jgi:hypothetical protein
VIVASQLGLVVWYENTLQTGSFVRHQIAKVGQISAVVLFDADGDGLPDIVTGGRVSGELTLFKNRGDGAFEQVASGIPTGDRSFTMLDFADFDGDGDADLLTDYGWHENLDGLGHFDRLKQISSSAKAAVDFDRDGDADIVAISPNAIVWHRNDRGEFSAAMELAPGEFYALHLADFDADNHLDIVATSERTVIPGVITVAGYRFDVHFFQGTGTAEVRRHGYVVVAGLLWPYQLGSRDVNGDGRLDLLVAGQDLSWNENRILGDVNRDNVFDQQDLILAFQAGKYESDLVRDATFDSGDWNNDGEFTSADLVAVFVAGGYQPAAM